ncbi:MAG: hypothetical protein QNJ98_18320 [Planctomycetota bacterium]|nr:hypothetical protein [Planctomycetota bacterium]
MGLSDRLCLKKATGVLIDAEALHLCVMGKTPTGTKAIREERIPIGEGGVQQALTQLREDGALSGTTTVTLDARSVYFATKLQGAEVSLDPEHLLPPFLLAGSRFVHDVRAVKVKQGLVASIAACQRTTASEVLNGLAGIGRNQSRLEPAPMALLGEVLKAGRAPRKWKNVVRVVVDGDRGLAFLLQGRTPLAWKPFSAKGPDRVHVMAGVIRGLRAYARAELGMDKIDGVALHCAEADQELGQACHEACGLETKTLPAVAIDDAAAARAAAIGGMKTAHDQHCLLSTIRPPATLRELFPWTVAILLGLVVFASGWWVRGEADAVQRQIRSETRRMRKNMKAAGVKLNQLAKKHIEYAQYLDLSHKFSTDRVFWAPVLRDLPNRLPESTVLSGVRGRDSFTMPALRKVKNRIKKRESREIRLQGQLRMARGKPAPEEVTSILESLAASEAMQTSFPLIKGANVIRKQGKEVDLVTYFATCGRAGP